MTAANLKENRPLSPHLQVYKPQITSVLSILHRMTGFLLSIGALGIALWLWSVAYNPELYDCLRRVFTSQIGQIALVGWTVCFYYHLANGVRHLFWDIGKGYGLKTVTLSGWAVLLFTAGATAFTWLVICGKIDL